MSVIFFWNGGMAACCSYCPCQIDIQLRYGKKISSIRRLRWVQRPRLVNQLVVTAQLSNALDSQPGGISNLPWIGPLPGDIAEVEAYCRIFRAAEQLYNSLMDTICDPVTGECTILYDVPSEDKHLLDDKIFSVLGCMVCLLNKGREDVLSGRSLIINSFRDVDVDVMDDKLPPLAFFRGEMKRYCESLHVALENYLTPYDPRGTNIWRKLQRLKNLCYDSGFPRGDDHPGHTLFANWNPLYFSSEEETQSGRSEVAFWRGGQVTEEGLRWLLERGFKTIIDLRAENIKDNFYEKVLHEAIFSGDIEVLKLPVEVGTTPSLQQVEKFAALVSDVYRRPIYLHSREGVWRTSAMVSRWRQYMTRYTPHVLPNTSKAVTSSVNSLRDSRRMQDAGSPLDSEEGKTVTNEGTSASDHKYGTLSTRSYDIYSAGELSNQIPNADNKYLSKSEADDTTVASTWKGKLLAADGGEVSDTNVNPLKSQQPPSDMFSRYEMSTYFRRKVSPATYFTHEKKSSGLIDVTSELYNNAVSSTTAMERRNIEAPRPSADENLELIARTMCASITGVVRLQSRRKAEMYLVRTDGFSCTREKVTESSLAFTHPSTQQQMLLWKSTPKTVLLLKKLGRELMEEAKEVLYIVH